MGDTIKPEVTGKQLRSLNRYLPDLLQTLGDNTGPYNQAMINARALTDPQQLALDQSLLSYFGPQFNEIGSNLIELWTRVRMNSVYYLVPVLRLLKQEWH